MMGAVKEGLSHANAKENIEEKVIYCEISHAIHITLSVIQKKGATQLNRSLKWRLPTLPHFTAVPSALMGLTSLFGMGRGGTPLL